jgi:Ca2+/Na+ antiporter
MLIGFQEATILIFILKVSIIVCTDPSLFTDDYLPIQELSHDVVFPAPPMVQTMQAPMEYSAIFLVICLLILLLLVFRALSHVCEGFLVPAVEVLINEFDVPEELAGVTLLAFGSAAPEITMNSVSSITQDSSISLTSILGSAMIAFGLIPGLCILMTNRCKQMKLSVWPILREVTFFSATLLYFFFSIADGVVTTRESLHLILVYVFYVLLVFGMFYFRKQDKSLPKQENDLLKESVDVDVEMPHILEPKPIYEKNFLMNIWTNFSVNIDYVFTSFFRMSIPSVAASPLESKSKEYVNCCRYTVLFRALVSLAVSIVFVTVRTILAAS